MISLATRRFLKSSIRPSIFNPSFFSFQSQQFADPKPTLVPSLTPFHIGISNFEFGKSVVRSLTNFDFVSHFSTSSSGWRENAGGDGGSDTGDEFSNLIAEIDRLEREVKSEKESLHQATEEFGAVIEEAKGLDHVEREKKVGPVRASLLQTFEQVKGKHERLERLIIRRQDLEVEKLKSHSKALGEAVEQFYSQGRCSNASNGGGNISWIDKPYVTWLLLWPCMWSITLAAPPGNLPDFEMLALFGFGALLLRVAKGSVNDLFYRDIDTKVGQTKLGHVGSGLLTPSKGLCLLGFQWLLGLGILLQLNHFCRVLAASSLLLASSYPLMKRFTFWPQAYRGLIFNWGALLGWAAIKGNLDPSIVLPLYASGVFWTLVTDVINAHQDKGGVKSAALHFGDSTKEWTTRFGIASLGCLALTGFNAELGLPYYAFLAVASGHLAWQIKSVDLSSRADFNIGWQITSVDLSSRADCNDKSVSNKWFGAIIFAGILAGKLSS